MFLVLFVMCCWYYSLIVHESIVIVDRMKRLRLHLMPLHNLDGSDDEYEEEEEEDDMEDAMDNEPAFTVSLLNLFK